MNRRFRRHIFFADIAIAIIYVTPQQFRSVFQDFLFWGYVRKNVHLHVIIDDNFRAKNIKEKRLCKFFFIFFALELGLNL